MVVNDSPGEECRIAILQDNHLEELYTERTATATNVGNIYKGRVTNVESAIQAAFVDYGQGQSGFLHISDLHPRYFPGAKRTERVGKKIPRRARPPIQEALKRGDEVLVQVLKEGLGTKGPTLTSYLSIPGRLLVMMPDMDRVGVSRKVEDPERRREMRQILETLTLPEGFGFILRTAGFDQSKTELNRDVAYLTRLWKVMEKRIKKVGAPCELYTESDLFIRTIRDVLRPSIDAIVVDAESAYERGSALLRVVAPRSAPKLILSRSPVPIFHAFDIERQIDLIHSREVPLPSGGKLVIDQTEALVAIDVNSGRSRRATDSETNAFSTNCEAVEEICRQLRLRDLGGLVINDLIDMRATRHRREIEERFRQALARDRAKTTALPISEFGVLQLTRQRMRPSLRKSHFMPCPHCGGRGEIKTPESVGADAMRQIGYMLQFERVRRVEVVCSPRVASVLLSGKRRELVGLEDTTGKKIDVRVSDTIAVDRVDFYAYDERNADIDVSKLPALKPPSMKELETAEPRPAALESPEAAPPAKKRRRRRRAQPADATAIALAAMAEEIDADDLEAASATETVEKKPGRRRKRGGRRAAGPKEEKEDKDEQDATMRVHELATELGVASREILSRARTEGGLAVKNHMSSVTRRAADLVRKWFRSPEQPKAPAAEAAPPAVEGDGEAPSAPKKKKRGRRRGRAPEAEPTPEVARSVGAGQPQATEPVTEKKKKKTRRSRRKRGGSAAGATPPEAPAAAADAGGEPVAAPDRAPQTTEAARSDPRVDRPRSKRRRGRRKAAEKGQEVALVAAVPGDGSARPTEQNGEASEPAGRPLAETAKQAGPVEGTTSQGTAARPPAPKRGLYRSRRAIAPGPRPPAEDDSDE
jgi:ribonuclease E